MTIPERKKKVLKAFLDCFSKFNQVIMVDLLNISTKQITQIRKMLHKQNGIFLVGKNTIALLAIRLLTEDVKEPALAELQKNYARIPHLKDIIPKIVEKVAFIFTEKSYIEIKKPIESEIVKVAAKPGILAPDDVWVKAGPTSIDPGKFGDFQRLGIQTKTAKQSLEIQKDAKICTKGELVTETIAAMCRMLNIIPFEYGMKINNVFLDGQFIPREIIDMPSDSITTNFQQIVRQLMAISVEAKLINSLSVPHILSNTFKSVLAIGLEANIKMPILENLAKSAASTTKNVSAKDTTSKEDNKKASKKQEEVKEEVVEPELEMDLGDMFG